MTSEIPGQTQAGGAAPLSRRAALARLGPGAAAVCAAPVVLHLDRSANAEVVPTPCAGKGKGKGPAWCRRDAPSP